MAKTALEYFIDEALVDKDKDGPLSQFVLMHLIHGGQGHVEIDALKIPAKGAQLNAQDLATRFRTKAASYSEDLPGVQTFVLLAFFNNRNEPQARKPFTVKPKLDYDGLTEPPTEAGRTSQRMRHDEALIQQVYRKQSQLDEVQFKLIDRLMRDNASQAEELRDANTILIEMLRGQVRLDAETEMAKNKYIRETDERRRLLGLAPALINTIAGEPVFPQETADKALVDALADSLSPEAVMLIQGSGAIKQELLGPLMARFEKRAREREKEEAQRAKLLPPPQTGAQDPTPEPGE
jgi:hypothetical protein